MRIVLERDDLAAAASDILLERRFDHRSIRIVGNQRRVGSLPGRGGILHDARHVRFRQEAQQIDAARRHIGVGGKGDDRNVARARDLPDDAHRLREQRAEDQFGAFVERLLRGQPRAVGRAAVVFHQKLNVRRFEFGERHFGGVAHRLAGNAGIAAGRQRQNQRDLDLAGAERRLGHWRPGRRLRRRASGR